jgi:hypothetical protein
MTIRVTQEEIAGIASSTTVIDNILKVESLPLDRNSRKEDVPLIPYPVNSHEAESLVEELVDEFNIDAEDIYPNLHDDCECKEDILNGAELSDICPSIEDIKDWIYTNIWCKHVAFFTIFDLIPQSELMVYLERIGYELKEKQN